jgi:cell division protein FtsW
MALVKTPLGVTSHGATRWLGVGSFQFQPAEVAKIAVIVTMSYLIVSMGRKVKTLKGCSVLLVTGGIMTAGAYLLTDNLSTAIIILGITVGMIFIAHPKTRIFILLFAVAAFLVMLGVLYINLNMQDTSRFRLRRVLVWLHPEDYASGDGYQTLQALYAIGSGGLFGRGLGNSIQKLGSVPEAQNDMIFSIICEELGLFGGIMVMLLFAYLLYRLFFIAQNAPDMFGSMLVSGIFVHIALQVVLNIAVVLNLMPNTGITLPFISYGGTSVAFLMAEMGLALSVARQIRFQNPQGDS